jgi:hypothetical protein
MILRYNHPYTIGFSVDGDHAEGATEREILRALHAPLTELHQWGEALEAVGVPEETIDNLTGLEVDPA